MTTCQHCESEFKPYDSRAKFCSRSCSASYNNKGRKRSDASKNALSAVMVEKAKQQQRTLTCASCGSTFVGISGAYCSKQCWADLNRDKILRSREKAREKLPDSPFRGKIGGYRPRAGRGHHGYYQGVWCDSTWEMAFVHYCLTQGLPFERNTKRFPYVFEEKLRNYIPDFFLHGEFIEIKGYLRPSDTAKIEQFPHRLRVISGAEALALVEQAKRDLNTRDLASLYSEKRYERVDCPVCHESFEQTSSKRRNTYCSNRCSALARHQKNGPPDGNRTR